MNSNARFVRITNQSCASTTTKNNKVKKLANGTQKYIFNMNFRFISDKRYFISVSTNCKLFHKPLVAC